MENVEKRFLSAGEQMNWKAGDRALIVNCSWWHYCGEVTFLVRKRWSAVAGKLIWEIDLPAPAGSSWVGCGDEHLKPIPPDEEQGSWEAIEAICGWTPKELVTEQMMQMTAIEIQMRAAEWRRWLSVNCGRINNG